VLERQAVSEGPELAPLTPKLPHTPVEHLQAMFLQTVILGLKDRDGGWINSPDFVLVCDYAGLEINVALSIRRAYNQGTIDFRKLEFCSQ
jgi:hypothetical protein